MNTYTYTYVEHCCRSSHNMANGHRKGLPRPRERRRRLRRRFLSPPPPPPASTPGSFPPACALSIRASDEDKDKDTNTNEGGRARGVHIMAFQGPDTATPTHKRHREKKREVSFRGFCDSNTRLIPPEGVNTRSTVERVWHYGAGLRGWMCNGCAMDVQ